MIYSPDHKFLLLKNHKVAGTPLEIELSKVLPENATVTHIFPEYPGHNPRNFNNFKAHSTFEEVKDYIFTDTKSVVFVRNPFEQVASYYFMLLNFMSIANKWEDNIDNYFGGYLLDEALLSTRGTYTINNEIVVDHILRYELGVEDQINPILNECGIGSIALTANAKKYIPEGITYKDIFNDQHRGVIEKEWKWELETFSYEY